MLDYTALLHTASEFGTRDTALALCNMGVSINVRGFSWSRHPSTTLQRAESVK
jgi:hypothetical protein